MKLEQVQQKLFQVMFSTQYLAVSQAKLDAIALSSSRNYSLENNEQSTTHLGSTLFFYSSQGRRLVPNHMG
jgi:hypothetical protein